MASLKTSQIIDRRDAILRDMIRCGGRMGWDYLNSHGHNFSAVQACVRAGELTEFRHRVWEITETGRAAVEVNAIKPHFQESLPCP